MKTIILLFVIFSMQVATCQSLYVEFGGGFAAPISTTSGMVTVENTNRITSSSLSEGLVGYRFKNNAFINTTIRFGHLANIWHIFAHTYTLGAGDAFDIIDKYSINQIGLHIGHYYPVKKHYFLEYSMGLNYTDIK